MNVIQSTSSARSWCPITQVAHGASYGNHFSLFRRSEYASIFKQVNGSQKSQRRTTRMESFQGGTSTTSGMAPELKAAVEDFLAKSKVVLFMKGTKQFPQCGFSNTCVQILNTTGVPYETVNILEDESLRSGMKEFSQWPTFPQFYVQSEFIGGCDIMIEQYQNGELQELLEAAINS